MSLKAFRKNHSIKMDRVTNRNSDREYILLPLVAGNTARLFASSELALTITSGLQPGIEASMCIAACFQALALFIFFTLL